MKKSFSIITVIVIFTSVFSMFSVVNADTSSYYTATEYAKYDFESASELSDFTLSNSASDWSVSDDKLIYNTVDTSAHTFAKDVDIPAGQSFALEFKSENIYHMSDLKVYLNNTSYMTITVDNGTQANDGAWLILFDRINGIKVYKDGVRITTQLEGIGQPYLKELSNAPIHAIENIKIEFQGSTDIDAPRFDYFYVYSFGDVQKYINEFDSSSELSDFKLGGGTSTVSDGKWVISNVNESWPQRIGIEADATQDLIVDFNLTHTNTYKRVEIQPNWKGLGNSGNIPYPSGEHTAIYNRSDDKIYVYQNGSKRYDRSLSLSGAPITVIGLGFLIGTGHSASLDYFDVYIQGMKAGVSDVTAKGLKLHTNMPLDLTDTVLSVGGNDCIIAKAADYFTYDVTFASEIEASTDYSLSANFKTLTGRSYSDTIAFTTPITQDVLDALDRLNSSKINPSVGEEDFRAVVTEVANKFGIGTYSGNDKIVEIAANLRDEKGGFTDKADVKKVFEQADILFSKKGGDIDGFISYINTISPFDDELIDAYNNRIADFAKAMIGESMSSAEFKNIADVKAKFESFVILYGITFADNNDQIGYLISEFGQNKLNLTEEEISKDSSSVDEKLRGQAFASLSDVASKYREIISDIEEGETSGFYYINSDFDKTADKNKFQLSSTADWSVSGGKLLCDTHKNNETVHTIGKDVNIAKEDNFVVEFACEHLYRWSDISIYIDDVEAVKVNAVNASFDGTWKFIFDRTDGIKTYKNDIEVFSDTNPKIAKSSMSGVEKVSKIEIKFRGSHDKGDGVCNFDYIKVYKITSDVEIKSKDSAEWDNLEIEISPIVPDGTDLKDYIFVDDAPVSGVDKIGNNYRVRFSGTLTPNAAHKLNIKNLLCNYGITIDGDFDFKTRDREKDISMYLLNPMLLDSKLKSKVLVETKNEFGDSIGIKWVAAVYTAGGNMVRIEPRSATFSEGIEFFDLDIPIPDQNIIVELYAVDSLDTFNRVSKKNVYYANDGAFSAQTELLKDIDNEGLTVVCQKDLAENKITVTASSEEGKQSEFTLAVSKGYDTVAPSFDFSNLQYIKNEVLSENTKQITVNVPDGNMNYDIYKITKENGVQKLQTVSMHKADDIASAFNRLKTSKINPASGEENIKDVVADVDVVDIFGITEYKDNDDIIELAANLRDEQGGFADENDVITIFKLADFIFGKNGGDIDGFIGKIIPSDDDALKIYKNNKISQSGIDDVKNCISNAKFSNLEDVRTKFGEYVVLSGIKTATHYSQISNLIKTLGTSVMHLTENEVSGLRDDISTSLLNKSFGSISALKSEYKSLISKPAEQNVTYTGLSGGNSSSGGTETSFSIVPKTQSDSGFSDIETVPWAKDSILRLQKKGIISGRGNGKFAPNDDCTRAEIARMICSALDLSFGSDFDFADVSASDWSYSYISAVYKSGIMMGIDETEFAPDMSITREMLAVIICRAAQYSGKRIPDANADFEDILSASEYARESIGALQKVGIVSGVDGVNFAPKKQCTRAEIARIIDGFLQYMEK